MCPTHVSPKPHFDGLKICYLSILDCRKPFRGRGELGRDLVKQARGAPYFLPFVVKTYVLSIAVGNAPNSHLLHE